MMRAVLLAILYLTSTFASGQELITFGNDSFNAGISLTTGGVLHFGPKERNLLYVNPTPQSGSAHSGWSSYGGDWIWSTLQSTWPFHSAGELTPPEKNNLWHVLSREGATLVIESNSVKTLGIQMRRSFTIDSAARRLVIENTLLRVRDHPQASHIWSVTQLPRPEYVLLDIAWQPEGVPDVVEISRPNRVPPEDYERLNQVLKFECLHSPEHAKIGTLGRWLAAVYPDGVFLQQVDFHPGECYPELSSTQVYVNSRFLELELLSPNQHLAIGQTINSRVVWEWRPLANANPTRLATKLKDALK